jgi:hypothetical protein
MATKPSSSWCSFHARRVFEVLFAVGGSLDRRTAHCRNPARHRGGVAGPAYVAASTAVLMLFEV